MNKKVIVAGHICLDITPVFAGRAAERVEQILSPGKLIQVGNADVHTGGAVANTGLAMKILGNDVSLIGKIGRDQEGKELNKVCKESGVNTDQVLYDDTVLVLEKLKKEEIDLPLIKRVIETLRFVCKELEKL